jgi:tripartite-type tricarboxylate transporter receptor subunit TctC
VPAQNTVELIALARAQPGKLNFASAGNGSSSHLAGELFKSLADVDMVHIPYKGAAPALADLLGGHIQVAFDPLPSSLSNVKAGKLRGIGVTTPKKSPLLPEVPTLAESGVSGYELNGWSGFLVPAGTPRDVITQLNNEVVKIIGTADTRARFAGMGFETVGDSPAQFQAFIDKEVVKWGKVVKQLNISAD